MNERIKEVRKLTGQTQKDFGESLGVNRGTLTSYETGRVVPSKTFLQLLCTTYMVNEEWLVDGTGPMRPETKEDAIERFARENGFTGHVLRFLKLYFSCEGVTKEAADLFLETFLKAYATDTEEVEEATAPIPAQAKSGSAIFRVSGGNESGVNASIKAADEIAPEDLTDDELWEQSGIEAQELLLKMQQDIFHEKSMARKAYHSTGLKKTGTRNG